MKKILLLLITILISTQTEAQFIKGKSLTAQIGYGLSAPYNSADDIVDSGLFLQGELVLKLKSWIELRPYAGLLLTNSNGKDIDGNLTNEKAETKAFLLGGKVRVRAPIPWIAPYVEVGLGTSIGKFETFTAFHDTNKSGVIYHIPYTLGLELGKNNNVDLSVTYYEQPSVNQYVGAVAIGISIPLRN